MGNQRTQTKLRENTNQINSAKKTAESKKQPGQLYENSHLIPVMDGASQSGILPAQQNILFLQRTIGNQAVGRLIQTYLNARQPGNKYEPRADRATGAAANITGAIFEQQNEASIQGQIKWGKQTDAEDWGMRSMVRSDSGNSPSWGASAGISYPQPVSWGTMENMGEVRQGITGAAASGPPVSKDLLTVQTHSGGAWDVGWTYFPKVYKAPDFDFNASPKWFAKPTLKTKAFEGTADSFFVPKGTYKTKHKEGGKDVYWIFSAAMSARDKAAEQEHCNDHKYAYKISLKEAEQVLKKYVIGKTFGPKATSADVEQLVLNRIKAKLVHPQLGNDKTKWSAKYDMLFRKTGERDVKGWHTFNSGNRKEIKDPAGTVIKVTYNLIKGTTKIGVVKSPAIIKY